jgi:hypothetical protein
MIKDIINYFICKIKKHNMVDAGSCPFTGKTYMGCLRCEDNSPKMKKKIIILILTLISASRCFFFVFCFKIKQII